MHTYRILAIPFGSREARDKQGEYFTPRTDVGRLRKDTEVVLTWHHGQQIGPAAGWIGYATDWEKKADGWWATAYVENELVGQMLARTERPIFASSASAPHIVLRADDGEILRWPLVEQALTFDPIDQRAIAQRMRGPEEVREEAEYGFRLNQVEQSLRKTELLALIQRIAA